MTWSDPNTWVPYWNRHFGDDIDDGNDTSDSDDEYDWSVFYNPPRRWKSTGIIHPASFDVYSTNNIPCYKDFFKSVLILNKMGRGSLVDCPLHCC